VSTQIIAALRRRADALRAEASELDPPDPAERNEAAFVLRIIADEFRALADEAEGATP
jgi:hypothetical protein